MMSMFEVAVVCSRCRYAAIITAKEAHETGDIRLWKCGRCRTPAPGNRILACNGGCGREAEYPTALVDWWRCAECETNGADSSWREWHGRQHRPTAADLNAMQNSAVEMVQAERAKAERLRAELEAAHAALAGARQQRDEVVRDQERREGALDEVTRFLAGLNLQDHPIAAQKERDRVVHRAMAVLKPDGVQADLAGARAQMRKALRQLSEYSHGVDALENFKLFPEGDKR